MVEAFLIKIRIEAVPIGLLLMSLAKMSKYTYPFLFGLPDIDPSFLLN